MICIRKAKEADYPAITNLIEEAFRYELHGRHLSLAEMIDSDFYIPELSLVAEINNHKIIGHIYLIETSIDYTFLSLGLIQIAVTPEYQRMGIGSMMMKKAHQKAKELGYDSVIASGGEQFLSKFGYQTLDNFGIHCGLVEDHRCLAVELYPGAMTNVRGKVAFPLEYYKIIIEAISAHASESIVA